MPKQIEKLTESYCHENLANKINEIIERLNDITVYLSTSQADKEAAKQELSTYNETDKFVIIVDDGTKKTSELLAECKALFPVWSYYTDEQLDEFCPTVKTSNKYLNEQEPNDSLANMSYNDIQKNGIKTMSLQEYLIFTKIYFKKTGKHLDEKYITLTSSQSRDGCALRVDWHDGEMRVSYGGLGSACDDLRSRKIYE